MGYCSDVYVMCEDKAHEMFLDLFAEMKALNRDNSPDLESYAKGLWLMKWDGWKWYDGYPEIDSITQLLNKLDGIDAGGYSYKFIRLGEDNDDVEVRENESAESNDHMFWEFYPVHAVKLPTGYFNPDEFKTTWRREDYVVTY